MRQLKALAFFMALCVCTIVGSVSVMAQEEMETEQNIDLEYPAPEESPSQPIFSEADKYTFEFNQLKEQNRLYQTLGVVIAGMLSLIIVLYVISKSHDYSAQDVIYASGLVFVIFGTIAIVVVADVEQQLTASIGIMGAIAGYLFGRMHDRRNVDGGQPPKGHE